MVFLEVLFLRRLAYPEHAAIDERRLSEISVVGPDKYCTARPQALNVLFGLACTQKAVEYFLGFILIDHFGHHYRAVRTGVVNAYLEAHDDHSLRSNAPAIVQCQGKGSLEYLFAYGVCLVAEITDDLLHIGNQIGLATPVVAYPNRRTYFDFVWVRLFG